MAEAEKAEGGGEGGGGQSARCSRGGRGEGEEGLDRQRGGGCGGWSETASLQRQRQPTWRQHNRWKGRPRPRGWHGNLWPRTPLTMMQRVMSSIHRQGNGKGNDQRWGRGGGARPVAAAARGRQQRRCTTAADAHRHLLRQQRVQQ